MAEKKEKVVFWADPDRTFGDGILFGEEVTGMIDGDRLEKWLDDGTVTEEKPESVAHASQTKLAALTKKCEEQELEIAELKSAAKTAPKNIASANKKLKAMTAELDELKEARLKPEGAAAKEIAELKAKVEKLEGQIIEKEIEVENLTAKVKELEGDK